MSTHPTFPADRDCVPRKKAVVPAKAERVSGWIEEHSNILLRLVLSHGRSDGDRLGDCTVTAMQLTPHHPASPAEVTTPVEVEQDLIDTENRRGTVVFSRRDPGVKVNLVRRSIG